jgi:hypothetical protein
MHLHDALLTCHHALNADGIPAVQVQTYAPADHLCFNCIVAVHCRRCEHLPPAGVTVYSCTLLG